MNRKTKSIISAGILMLQPFGAFAQSAGSHGGDERCAEFYQLASQVSVELAKIGQIKIDETNRLINVDLLRDQVMRPLTVRPAHGLPRQAVSNPSLDSTDLDVDQWDAIGSSSDKIKLVTHELMVLTGAESDGEYAVTTDAIHILADTPFFSKLKYQQFGKYTVNPDRSATFKSPQYGSQIGSKSSALGVCRAFGFSKSISTSEVLGHVGDVVILDSKGHVAESRRLHAKRKFNGLATRSGYYDVVKEKVLSSITCE